jgi:hypothetical protein
MPAGDSAAGYGCRARRAFMNSTRFARLGRHLLLTAGLCGLLYGLDTALLAADTQVSIDWARAQQLFNKSKQGETLSPEDQAYLDRAKAERQKRAGKQAGKGSRQGSPPPAPRSRTGLIPLDQMTAQDHYKGQDGGLYGGGRNEPPALHLQAAMAESAKIVPLDADGKPSPKGKMVMLGMGMSNTTMEYSVFKQLADAEPAKSPWLVIVDGAQGGQDAAAWANNDAQTWRVVEQRLQAAGVTPKQVQAVWYKQARIAPARFGEFPKHNQELTEHIVKNLHLAKERYPNLRIAYLSTRIYAGYATTSLNPEPYAYENAFAVRDLLLKQIAGDPALNYDSAKGEVKSPLLLWGPYLWADGLNPRKSDGLVWKDVDFRENDRTHPSAESGREKVARLLLAFVKTDPTAKPWFLAGGAK